VPLPFWQRVPADGQTPQHGTVIDFDGVNYAVDIGLGVHGTLPWEEHGRRAQHDLNTKVTVYIVGRDWWNQQLKLSALRHSSPRLSIEQLVADGQTPYRAEVLHGFSGGGWVLDIGCEKNAFLPGGDPAVTAGAIEEGAKLTVFIRKKGYGQSPLEASSERLAAPRERLGALVADGITPYEGVVRSVKAPGWFIDIGCEATALLLRSTVKDPSQMPGAGERATVYIWTRSVDVGKIYVRLEPRQTPALTFDDIRADGVTPYQGTVVRQSEQGAFVDIGCEQICLLKRADLQADAHALASLTDGDVLQVFARGKNYATKNIALTTKPADAPRIQFADVQDGTVYDGVVVRKLHELLFVDFQSEVTGVVSIDGRCPAQVGDRVRVQPRLYEARWGRWQMDLVP